MKNRGKFLNKGGEYASTIQRGHKPLKKIGENTKAPDDPTPRKEKTRKTKETLVGERAFQRAP